MNRIPDRRAMVMALMKKLIQRCLQVFSSDVIAPVMLDELCRWLNMLRATDLLYDLETADCYFGSPVQYMHLYGGVDDVLHVGIFFVKKGSVLPLHDHPNMTVLSRVLYGSAKVTSFDWLGAPPSEPGVPAPVECVDVSTVTPESGTRVLHPNRRNIHRIEALTDTAFIDIISPPYAEPDRPCTYYLLRAKQGAMTLEIDPTEAQELDVVAVPYQGPLLEKVPSNSKPNTMPSSSSSSNPSSDQTVPA